MPGPRWIWAAFLVFAFIAGCEQPSAYRALEAPIAEVPTVNVPPGARQRNWRGPDGSGSCVHASLSSHWHWLNQFELAQWWRSQYAGGEYATRLRRRLDDAQIPYAFTEQANIRLLDDAHTTRRGAIIWWKPSHCCTFVGWAMGSDGRSYACILDNNRTEHFEYVERSQFHKAWADFGGFGLMTLFDAPTAPIWQSYEPIQEAWRW